MSRKLTTLGFGLPIGMLLLVSPALAAAVEGQLAKQATNWVAIGMFFVFVLGTLGITYWAARRTNSRASSTPRAAASPASRTGWRSPATTCRRPRSSVFPRWSIARAMTG